MLQPKSYPELLGKALVLEADPFVTLVDDDNPWVEGLFLIVCVGVALAVADLVGGLLLTASLPAAGALEAALLQGWRQLAALTAPATVDPAQIDASFQQLWRWAAALAGYRGGAARLLAALLPGLALLLQWLLYGVAGHLAARALGGRGKLSQTLGATALAAAPHLLLLLTLVPFVAVSRLLLAVWALLIAYRAVEIAHDLPWQRAAIAVLAGPAALALLSLAVGLVAGMLAALGVAA
ncbi:MAG TPA: YIP1 family protein [Caldilineaceae bacterium]|nr:YIP1 family protein [Caldilineaceae bacterium]